MDDTDGTVPPRADTASQTDVDQQKAPRDGAGEPDAPTGSPGRRHRYVKRSILSLVVLAVLGLAIYYGAPWVERSLHTVSTDDAYVAGHVTYLGPRIPSRVESVLVDEDDYVRAGTTLVRLDAEPYRLAVEKAQADLQLAQAGLSQAEATLRADFEQVQANRFLVQSAIDQTRLEIASLGAACANLELDKAKLVLAEKEFARVSKLTELNAEARADYDQSVAALEVARNQVASRSETIQEIRATLGLARNVEHPSQVPADIERRHAKYQVALSEWATSLLKLGVSPDVVRSCREAEQGAVDASLPGAISPQVLADTLQNAPSVQLARARVRLAQAAHDRALLDVAYTEIKAPFDAFVTKRSVNPGDYATPGQSLLAIESLRYVWIEANFKETQLDDLRIGMPVEIYVDAYPGKMFSGHVAGFRPATGSRLSLLPPENATGNFVKVVQRLPVRIELDEPAGSETPLFVGLSVEPYVRYRLAPQGPDAGQRLRVPSGEWGGVPAEPAAAIDGQPSRTPEASIEQRGGM